MLISVSSYLFWQNRLTGDCYENIQKYIYKFIANNTAVFVAFMLLIVLSVCSCLFTFNFILNVMLYNDKAFDSEGISFAEQYLKEGALICGVMLVSVFNLAYVYSYILDTRKRELAISRISGQTVFSAIVASYLEILFLSTVAYIIGIFAMKLLVLPIISDHGFMFADSLDAPKCIALYLIFILIYSVVFLPSISGQIKKSPAEALSDE